MRHWVDLWHQNSLAYNNNKQINNKNWDLGLEYVRRMHIDRAGSTLVYILENYILDLEYVQLELHAALRCIQVVN